MALSIAAPGIHNVHNALAGIAVAQILNMGENEIKKGLEGLTGTEMRLSIKDRNGIKYINDSYNASPDSVMAALDVLCEIAGKRRKWAVLGICSSWESGRLRPKKIGRLISQLGIEYMVGIGSLAKWYIEGIQEDCHCRLSLNCLTQSVTQTLYSSSYAERRCPSFKGSRVMKLDVLVDELLNEG